MVAGIIELERNVILSLTFNKGVFMRIPSGGHVAVEVVPVLPEGADVNAALYQAARDNDDEMVIECLRRGANARLYHDGCTPIGIAALRGNIEVIIAFRQFYYERDQHRDLISLLDQPQRTVTTLFGFEVPFTERRYANFEAAVEAFYVDEADMNRVYLLGLRDEADSRAKPEVDSSSTVTTASSEEADKEGPGSTTTEADAKAVVDRGRGGVGHDGGRV